MMKEGFIDMPGEDDSDTPHVDAETVNAGF
jgi:hypothetical protein